MKIPYFCDDTASSSIFELYVSFYYQININEEKAIALTRIYHFYFLWSFLVAG